MGKRTLASCWRQFETLSEAYQTESKPRGEVVKKLTDLARKANADDIGKALSTLFVRPYIAVPIEVEFTMEMPNGNTPDWVTRYDEDANKILIHPLAAYVYIDRMRQVRLEQESQEDLVHWRYVTFLAEIAKLPSIHVLFMIVLQRVAYMLEIAHLEKRGGIIEIAEGETYHTLLWAFKETESFVTRTSGINVRAHYGLSWYESDWITGR
jgi:hypothetical protein